MTPFEFVLFIIFLLGATVTAIVWIATRHAFKLAELRQGQKAVGVAAAEDFREIRREIHEVKEAIADLRDHVNGIALTLDSRAGLDRQSLSASPPPDHPVRLNPQEQQGLP